MLISLFSERRKWIQVKKLISEADLVLEVVDARNPEGTRNKEIEKYALKSGKNIVIVINKSDLVPRSVLEQWRRVFSKEFLTVYISARERLGTKKLWFIIKKVAKEKISNKPVKAAVVGYPNTGKSAIINILKGKHSVGTSPKPGFTKKSTLIKASTWLKVLDTPGVYREKNEVEAVFKGCIEPEKITDPVVSAVELIKKLMKKKGKVFEEVYGVKEKEPLKILKGIGKIRGLVSGRGEVKLGEVAKIVIRDWLKGKIKVYFEPRDYNY